MKEKEREGEESGQKGSELEHSVAVGATLFTVKLPLGARLSDLLERIKDEAAERKLSHFNIYEYFLRLNDRDVEFEDGKLKEDPVLTEASSLLLVTKMTGGKYGK